MKTQRHPKSDPELRGVVVALCAVIVICAALALTFGSWRNLRRGTSRLRKC
jgi:hypothetical protein